MSNHSHILIKAENVKNISLFMKEINTEYARYYNTTRRRAGYVFRGRFKSEVINDEKHLLNCIAYILKRAEDYNYSSYANYLTKRGIVDFKEAKKYYDMSPSNMKEIMKEKSHSDWIEHDDMEYENYEEVLEELIKRYQLTKKRLEDDEILREVVEEIQRRTGLSLRKISGLLEINRERVRAVAADKGS